MSKHLLTLLSFFAFFIFSTSISSQDHSTCALAQPLVLDMNCAGTSGGANSGDPTGFDGTDGNLCSSNYSGGDDYIFSYVGTGNALELDLTGTGSWSGILLTEGCPTTGTCIADETSSATSKSLTSPALTAGVTYYIHISTWPSPQSIGEFCLNADETTPPMPPANDACADAIPITMGAAISGSTELSTNIEALTACNGGAVGTNCAAGVNDGIVDFTPGVWYVYTSETAESVTIEVTGFDTEIQVFTGSCGALDCFAGDDDSFSGGCCGSQVCFDSDASFAPVDYYIYIDGHGGATGDFDLTLNSMVLPLDLIDWKGSTMKSGNKLSWSTANEVNTESFSIEKLYDGSTWRSIGEVEAAGISTDILNYEFMDDSPTNSEFYRLKSMDLDGSFTYSDIIELKRSITHDNVNVYPNPFTDEVSLKLDLIDDQEITIEIVDITGKLIYQDHKNAQTGTNNFALNLANHQAGVYIITVKTKNDMIQKRVIKK